MRAFVTGASGFLGGRLTQLLAGRGIPVRVLARQSNNLKHLDGLGVGVVYGTLGDVAILRDALRDVTHVFHCAAASTDWAAPGTYVQANVTGTQNMLGAARSSDRLERFVHVSTTDVYGYPLEVCDESHPLIDAGLPYNRTKCLAERAVWQSGMPVTVVRPATIYGPRSVTFGSDLQQLLRQGLMAVIDGGRARGGFLYVDNAVDAMLAASVSPDAAGRAYNLADGSQVTWRGYVDALADGLGLRRPWIDIPSGFALALANAMEAPHRYLRVPGRPLLTRHAVHLLARDQEFPIGRARRELGFAPSVAFEEGMARMVQWLMSCP